MAIAIELKAGTLYQVKHWQKGWIIAEYVKEIAPHSYKYNDIYFEPTIKTGPEKTRHVPLSHQWKHVRPVGYNSTFTMEDRKMEVRPVTEEAVATIAELRAEIQRLESERIAKAKELREFCE